MGRSDRRAAERSMARAATRAGCAMQDCPAPVGDVLPVIVLGLPLRLFVCTTHRETVRERLLAFTMLGDLSGATRGAT